MKIKEEFFGWARLSGISDQLIRDVSTFNQAKVVFEAYRTKDLYFALKSGGFNVYDQKQTAIEDFLRIL